MATLRQSSYSGYNAYPLGVSTLFACTGPQLVLTVPASRGRVILFSRRNRRPIEVVSLKIHFFIYQEWAGFVMTLKRNPGLPFFMCAGTRLTSRAPNEKSCSQRWG